jgi:hypothetical protein
LSKDNGGAILKPCFALPPKNEAPCSYAGNDDSYSQYADAARILDVNIGTNLVTKKRHVSP